MRKSIAIILASGLALAAPAHAQVDWGGIMQTEAMNSAIDEAAREGTASRGSAPVRSADASSAKARSDCAKVRGWVARGVKDARLPQLIGLCRQLGY